jgi:hypothetical protein
LHNCTASLAAENNQKFKTLINQKVPLPQSREEMSQITRLLQKTLQPLYIRQTMETKW